MQVYCLRMHTWHQCMGRSLRRIPCHKYSYRGRFLPQRRFVRNVYNTLFQRRDLCKVNPLGIWHEAVVFLLPMRCACDTNVTKMWCTCDTDVTHTECCRKPQTSIHAVWCACDDVTLTWQTCDTNVTKNVMRMWHIMWYACDTGVTPNVISNPSAAQF